MNILLTSAGRRTYLIDYFKEVLKDTGRVYASNSVYTYSLSHADDYILTPQIYDSNYIEFLIEYCKQNNINAIISLFDIDLPVLSKHRDKFESIGVKVVLSNYEVISICNDKWLTYKFLTSIQIPTPLTFNSIESTINAIHENTLTYPIILKPRWGMGSIGIYIAENNIELQVLYSKLKREIFKTYLKFESSQDQDECIILQQLIKGQEYGLDVLNDLNGKYVTTIAKTKIAMRSGETDIAEIVDPAPFLEYTTRISEKLQHVANLDIDAFRTDSGMIYILELNCRFGGQYPFSHLAGVNFPAQIVGWLQGEETNSNFLSPKIGTLSCKDLTPVIIKSR